MVIISGADYSVRLKKEGSWLASLGKSFVSPAERTSSLRSSSGRFILLVLRDLSKKGSNQREHRSDVFVFFVVVVVVDEGN